MEISVLFSVVVRPNVHVILTTNNISLQREDIIAVRDSQYFSLSKINK